MTRYSTTSLTRISSTFFSRKNMDFLYLLESIWYQIYVFFFWKFGNIQRTNFGALGTASHEIPSTILLAFLM